ncbi:MAG: methyltransferase domain-containing protein [Asgard group archaeon]|nr:methyltransferase domain-containing protein [Asgard group archaeon]
MNEKKDIVKRYDAFAKVYDQRYYSIQEPKLQELLTRHSFIDDKYIIDIGCGTGFFFTILKEKKLFTDQFLIGADISYEMLQKAKKKNSHCEFVVADSDALPFKEGSIDTLTSITHLQNLPNPTITIKEMTNLLKTNGYLLISILRKKWSRKRLHALFDIHPLLIKDSWEANIEDIRLYAQKN